LKYRGNREYLFNLKHILPGKNHSFLDLAIAGIKQGFMNTIDLRAISQTGLAFFRVGSLTGLKQIGKGVF
jgi:hypothetical protein